MWRSESRALLKTIKQHTRRVRKKLSKPAVKLAALGLAWIYKAYMGLVWHTSRVEAYGMARAAEAMQRHHNIVVALWHDNVVLAPRCCKVLRPTTLASRSDIGEVITAVLERQDYHVFRGGSSKGKSRRTPVLRQLTEYLNKHEDVVMAVTVDGSTGPARVMKPGAIALASDTDSPLFSIHIACRPAIKAPSWDRTRFPLPFGKIVIIMEGPLHCDKASMDGDTFRHLREQGQLLLDDTAKRAEQALSDQTPDPPDPRLDLDPSYGERDVRHGRNFILPHESAPNPRPRDEQT